MLRDDGMLFIGSTNFSTNAIENNRELALIFQDKKSSQVFLDAFNQECRGNRARKPR
jgi:phosphatidylserine/phosphatidylglycerophosphate/cardiolipin synthase-like enzyme